MNYRRYLNQVVGLLPPLLGWDRSISRSLTVSLVLLACLVISAIQWLAYQHQSREMRQAIERKADEYSAQLADMLAPPLGEVDERQIRQIGAAFAQHELIQTLRVVNAAGKPLFEFVRSAPETPSIKRTHDIVHQDQRVGRAELSLSLADYQRQTASLLRARLLTLVVAVLVLAVATRWLLSRLLRRPLAVLQQEIERVAAGVLPPRFNGLRQQELLPIIHRFQDMAAMIQAREHALQVSERHYRELVENANSIILRINNQGVITFFNEFAQQFFGYHSQEILGRNLVGTIVPEMDTAGRDLAAMLRALCQDPDRFAASEHETCRHDGERVWVAWANKALRDPNGHLTEILCIGSDVTERRRTEEVLRFTQFATEHIADAVYWTNRDGCIIYVNEAACRSLGYSREELLNTAVYAVDPHFPEDTWTDHWRQLKIQKTLMFESEHRTRAGHCFPVEIRANFLQFEGQEYNCAIVRDITERKQAEQTLRESENRFRTLIEQAPFGITIFRADGHVEYFNPAEGNMFGIDSAVREWLLTQYNILEDEQLAEKGLLPTIKRVFAEQTAVTLPVVSYTAKPTTNSHVGWVESFLYPIKNAQGATQEVVVIHNDVSKRVQAEKALRDSEQRYRELFEGNPHPMFVFDVKGLVFLAVNDAAVAHYGYTRDEFLGMTMLDIHPAQELAVFRRQMATTPADLDYVGSMRHCKKDGTIIDVEVTSHQLFFAGRPARLVLAHDITALKRAEAALRASEERFRTLFEQAGMGISLVDYRDDRIIDCNPALARLLGYTRDELKQLHLCDLSHPDDESTHQTLWEDLLMGKQDRIQLEKRYHHKDGRLFWGLLTATLVRDAAGQPVYAISTVEDIDERRRAQEHLLLWSKVLADSAEGIMITDAEQKIITVNAAFTQISGYPAAAVIGKTPRVLQSGRQDADFYRTLWATLLEKGRWQGEIWNRRQNGAIYPVWLSISAVRNEAGATTHYIALLSDISERKTADERILRLAHYDALTELPNRTLLQDRVQQALANALRHGTRLALLFFDLDRFKDVNDTLGHDIGDQLLQMVAQRLREIMRESDTVARMGGDEFIIVLGELQQASDSARVAQKIINVIAEPFWIKGQELHITPSIGISVYPDDGHDLRDLIKNADVAMYHAKKAGRNAYQFFTPDMNARAYEVLALENSLRRALERNEFLLHYQPQIDTATGSIIGAEALVRWQHPEGGLVPPDKFIPVAEERGLVAALDEWVLSAACQQNRQWQDAGLPPIPVAVNLSVLQFQRTGFVEQVAEVLAQTGLAADFLDIELTESLLMRDIEAALLLMQRLKALGVHLSIDDFGTGYSSLNYLKRLSLDRLKVDASFVRAITADPDAAAITEAIINLGHHLHLKVIAEGVETVEQLELLQRQGCYEMQGYFFSRPLPAAQFAELLRHPKGEWLKMDQC